MWLSPLRGPHGHRVRGAVGFPRYGWTAARECGNAEATRTASTHLRPRSISWSASFSNGAPPRLVTPHAALSYLPHNRAASTTSTSRGRLPSTHDDDFAARSCTLDTLRVRVRVWQWQCIPAAFGLIPCALTTMVFRCPDHTCPACSYKSTHTLHCVFVAPPLAHTLTKADMHAGEGCLTSEDHFPVLTASWY